MTRITVVIEDHGEGIHLGQQLAGGRVVAVMQGDHSGSVETLVRLVDPRITPSDGDPAVLREIARAALNTAST